MNPEHLLLVVLAVVVLIYGPNKLPQLGSALGKTVKNVRDGMEGEESEAIETPAAQPVAVAAQTVAQPVATATNDSASAAATATKE